MERDLKHLKWLSYGFYVMSGLFAFFAVFSLIFLIFGILFLTTDILERSGNPEHAGYIFGTLNILVSIVFISVGLLLAFFTLRAGKNLVRQKNYTFCLVVAIALFLFQPLGMILGVLTIIVLMRDSVKGLFGENTTGG